MPDHANLTTTGGVDLSFSQMLGTWRIMSAAAPRAAQASHPGLECIFTGIPVPFCNVALITDARVTAAALATHGERACAFAADKDVPWLFVVTQETLDEGVDPAAALDGCGLAPAMPLTGMVAQELAPPARPTEGLDLVTPTDDDLYAAAIDINTAAYAMDLEPSKPLMGRRAFWQGHHVVVGLAGGAPACSAAVMMVDGLRYVLLVATRPDQQRRGFAEAAMRRALDEAAAVHGPTPTVLHATEAGRPIYARMGYRTIANHTVFLEKRFLEGH
jgi:GNAT superfamily N-acetyltransferase